MMLVTAIATGACAGSASQETQAKDPFAEPPRCSSGAMRDPNESEGPEMMPGRGCNVCHARSNAESGEADAPIFAFAGTVFPTGHEPDDCIASGSEGAVVTVTDAMGKALSATANASGNFFLETTSLIPPFVARVTFEGRTRAMTTPQSEGDCNVCHGATGRRAPGRIVLP